MTVKEILEKTEFGKEYIISIIDYNVTTIYPTELLLEMYKKALRKNAAYRYREIKGLLDQEAVVVEDNYDKFKIIYNIITRRSIDGPFGKPLDEYHKIIFE